MDDTTENTPQSAAADAPAEAVTSDGAIASGATSDGSTGDSEGGEPDAAPAAELVTREPVPCPPLTRLEEARALPEVGQDAKTTHCTFVPGTIEAFKGADDRTMRVACVFRDDAPVFVQQQVTR